MKNTNIIFYISTITLLVGNKLFELLTSFDMVIDPIGTSVKMVVLFVLALGLIKHIFLKEREKARN